MIDGPSYEKIWIRQIHFQNTDSVDSIEFYSEKLDCFRKSILPVKFSVFPGILQKCVVRTLGKRLQTFYYSGRRFRPAL